MSGDPQRLFESSDVPAELRADLQRAREDDPAAYDVAAGVAAFEAAIADIPAGIEAADPGTAAAVASKSATTTWVLVATIGAATAGIVAWALARRDAEVEVAAEVEAAPQRRAPAVEDREPSEPTRAEPPAEPPEQAEITPDAPEPTEVEQDREKAVRATGSRSKPRPRAAEPTPDRLAAEMRATKAAEEQLRSDPTRALVLARQADREFRDGLFAQERQAIVVLALFELGRVDEALAKAKRYLARHPRGSFADKIRAAVETAGG